MTLESGSPKIKLDLLSTLEAAKYLKVSVSAIYKCVREKRVAVFKIGRDFYFSKNDLDNIVDRRKKMKSSDNEI